MWCHVTCVSLSWFILLASVVGARKLTIQWCYNTDFAVNTAHCCCSWNQSWCLVLSWGRWCCAILLFKKEPFSMVTDEMTIYRTWGESKVWGRAIHNPLKLGCHPEVHRVRYPVFFISPFSFIDHTPTFIYCMLPSTSQPFEGCDGTDTEPCQSHRLKWHPSCPPAPLLYGRWVLLVPPAPLELTLDQGSDTVAVPVDSDWHASFSIWLASSKSSFFPQQRN